MSHIATVAAIYDAFGRGDVPFILASLSASVEWDAREHYDIPLLVPRRGPAEAGRFFAALADAEMRHFAVRQLFDGGDTVVAWVEVTWLWKPTGRVFSDASGFHLWQFDAAGKVSRFQHAEDTHGMWLATVAATASTQATAAG